MNLRRRIGLVLVWALSIMATAAWAASTGAQAPPAGEAGAGTIIAGENLGFRLEGRRDGMPTGTLVVRINGTWVEARTSLKVMPLK
jgi:hypothetical protein